jgi:hypothetical protein
MQGGCVDAGSGLARMADGGQSRLLAYNLDWVDGIA